MTRQSRAISVVGMGKLGTPFALSFADAGYKVYGIDENKNTIENLKREEFFQYEKNAKKLLKSNIRNLFFPDNYDDLVSKTDITFIIVPTPSEKDGSFSLSYILQVIDELGKALQTKKKRHTVVITSTVSPLSLTKILVPRLEHLSKKKVGKDIGLCYCPEFIALGSVIHNLTNPDFILIGESDIKSGDIVEKIRMSICNNKPKVVRTNWINAEIAKIALNTYITTKISFANMIARLCEHVPGADADIVTNTVGSDSRVGLPYLNGGMGFGGPCFPRDNKALASFITSVGQNPNIPLSVQSFNLRQTNELYKVIKKYIKGNNITIGILGLSYKPETDVVEESPSISLAKKLISKGMKVVAYDPAAMENARIVEPRIQYAHSIYDCINASDVVIITTAWKEFKDFPWKKYLADSNKIIIDCWRYLDIKNISSHSMTYISLGSYIS